MLAALGLFDFLAWLLPFVVAFLFWRRLGRFLNTVEARAVSIDEHLERIERATVKKRRAITPAPDDELHDARDRSLLELAAQRDRERNE